tara:strand:- start:626 stop:1177 length:552 start_codon:yes stop_codon:yes gene_type:complete
MFLIQLIYLSNKKKLLNVDENFNNKNNINTTKEINNVKKDAINQLKNIKQEEDEIDKKNFDNIKRIENLNDIIKICAYKKEIKLKYELENNVNLVSFSDCRIEISFNENLNKNFVKELSEKLFHWTNKRWIIFFSNEKGEISKKEKEKILKKKNITEFISSDKFKDLLKSFPDIELKNIKKND